LGVAQVDINGNPFIGIFCATNEEIVFVPKDIQKKVKDKIIKTLGLEAVQLSIAGSRLIGSLMAINSTGAIVNNFIETSELLILKKYVNVSILEEKLNAVGNNILTNDQGALVHKKFNNKSIKQIEDTLDVEVCKGTIAGIKTIGTTAVVTKHGGVCHPKVKDDEVEFLKSLFKIDLVRGTANYGIPLVGACIIANSKGAVTGTVTSGIELGRIEDGLNL
jgi:translation initiation factor 6